MRSGANPYNNEAGLVDEFIGTAYDNVKRLSENLNIVEEVNKNLPSIKALYEGPEGAIKQAQDAADRAEAAATRTDEALPDLEQLDDALLEVRAAKATTQENAAQTASDKAAANTSALNASSSAGTALLRANAASESAEEAEGFAGASLTSANNSAVARDESVSAKEASIAAQAEAEAAALETRETALYTSNSIAAFFARTSLVIGGRYTTKTGETWDIVAANTGDFNHPITGDGVKVVVTGIAAFVEAFNLSAANLHTRLTTWLAGASLGSPRALTCYPGTNVPLSGRLHVAPYSTVDFGPATGGGRITLTSSGRVTQDGRSNIRALIFATGIRGTSPYAMDSRLNSVAPSIGQFDTSFDIKIMGDRSLGSTGVHLYADSGYGLAWVRGIADVREMDDPFLHECKGGAYINENRLDYRGFAGRRFLREILDGGNEIDSNRISLICQPDNQGRAEIALYTDARKSTYQVKVWDWVTGNVTDPNLAQVVLSANTQDNEIRGIATGGTFTFPRVLDLSGRNIIETNNQRVWPHQPLPEITRTGVARADENNILADAYSRYTVTFAGDAVTAGSELRGFTNVNGDTRWAALSEASLVIDLGAIIDATDIFGVSAEFQSGYKPTGVTIDFSTDGTVWSTVCAATLATGGIPNILSRLDRLGLTACRYVRLSMVGTGARVSLLRLGLYAEGFSVKRQGMFAPSVNPTFYGELVVQPKVGNTGDVLAQGIRYGTVLVFSSQGGPRPTVSDAVTIGTTTLRYSDAFINRIIGGAPGPYADDAAAATAGVALNHMYRKTGGTMAWRQA